MKPILFNTEMVRAILEGRKTVTRRVVKFQLGRNPKWTGYVVDGLTLYNGRNEPCNVPAPYKVGDILYVRETWGCYNRHWWESSYFLYRADYPDGATTYTHDDGIHICDLPKWKPSIHMPKEAARIFLRVTDVRVERLQDITKEQINKEGFPSRGVLGSLNIIGKTKDGQKIIQKGIDASIYDFLNVWNKPLKKDQRTYYSWNANPYVWVIEFERIEKQEVN